MFENVFKILKITKKKFCTFLTQGGGRGGVHNSYNRTSQKMYTTFLSISALFLLLRLGYGAAPLLGSSRRLLVKRSIHYETIFWITNFHFYIFL